jgi:hypothetical protein
MTKAPTDSEDETWGFIPTANANPPPAHDADAKTVNRVNAVGPPDAAPSASPHLASPKASIIALGPFTILIPADADVSLSAGSATIKHGDVLIRFIAHASSKGLIRGVVAEGKKETKGTKHTSASSSYTLQNVFEGFKTCFSVLLAVAAGLVAFVLFAMGLVWFGVLIFAPCIELMVPVGH